MFVHLSTLALGASLLLPVADAVPKLNPEPLCKAVVNIGESLDARYPRCMAAEESARKKLEAEWTKFSAASRSSCAGMASGMGIQSYVELLTCLTMERDAAQMEEKEKEAAKKSGR
jgi:hypothetical protein